MAFYVEPKTAILILVVVEVSDHFHLVLFAQHSVYGLGNIESNEKPRHEEHWPSIITRPQPFLVLNTLKIAHSCADVVVQSLDRRVSLQSAIS